jgi:transposase
MPVREAAVLFKVSVAYIYKARIRRRLTGDAGINPNRGRPPRKLSPAQELVLAAHIRSQPGITLAQAQAWLLAEHGSGSAPARCGMRCGGSACRLKKP